MIRQAGVISVSMVIACLAIAFLSGTALPTFVFGAVLGVVESFLVERGWPGARGLLAWTLTTIVGAGLAAVIFLGGGKISDSIATTGIRLTMLTATSCLAAAALGSVQAAVLRRPDPFTRDWILGNAVAGIGVTLTVLWLIKLLFNTN
jgi:hypothetical protein